MRLVPDLLNTRGKRERIEWLGDNIGRTQRAIAIHLVVHGLRRHEHYWRVGKVRDGAQPIIGLDAIHSRIMTLWGNGIPRSGLSRPH